MVEHCPTKIAILLTSLKCGGAERVTLNLARAFSKNGIEVDILLMSEEGEFLLEAKSEFNLVYLQCNKTYKLPNRLLRYIVQRKPDIVISGFWKLNICACIVKLMHPHFKLILWEHSPPSKAIYNNKWLYAFSASILYRSASVIVAVSTGVLDDLRRWTVGLRTKAVVIFNPINPPSICALGVPKFRGGKHLIWVGRLADPKNPCLALEAFSIICGHCDATLSFVGDGPLRGELERMSESLGLSEHVNFLGFRSNPYELMIESDLLIVSSSSEGLPSVVI